jgi:4-amino-4-deoxy-L-arabinose transferase-like glycosyltransferase
VHITRESEAFLSPITTARPPRPPSHQDQSPAHDPIEVHYASPPVELRHPATRRRRHRWVPLAIVGLYLAVQIAVLVLWSRPAFLDESIYLTAGRRTLEGYGLSDQYLTWFAGSLLWPLLAIWAADLGGLLAARVLAAVCLTLAAYWMSRGTARIYGPRAGAGAAIVLVTSGPFLALGRLAVYDVLAVAGLALAFYAITRAVTEDHRRWLAIAAAAIVTASLAKYPALFTVPALFALMAHLRGRRARLDMIYLAFVVGAALVSYFLILRAPLVSLLEFASGSNLAFGSSRQALGYLALHYLAVPVLLAIAGVALTQRWKLGVALALPLPLWLLYHFNAGHNVGFEKHVVFATLYLAAPAGAALARLLWPRRWAAAVAVIVALGALGGAQMARISSAWPDQQPVVDFLTVHVEPADTILATRAWTFTQPLYEAGRLAGPWSIYDDYRLTHGQLEVPLCEADWFLDEIHGNPWRPGVRDAIEACGTFELVFVDSAPTTNLGADLQWPTYDIETQVWRNTKAGR